MRIAYAGALPPFSMMDARGEASGLVVEIVRAAMERFGESTTFVPVAFADMEAALADGRAELMIPTAITPERRQRLDFSSTLLPTGGALFVRAPQPEPFGLAALAGKTIVTPRTGPLAAHIAENAPAARLEVTADYESALARLVAGEADAAALNIQIGAALARRHHPGLVTLPRSMFLELPFAAAALGGRHGKEIAALDAGLAAIRADGTWSRVAGSTPEV